jgi:hypothetical protein
MHCILDLLRQSYTLPFKFEYLLTTENTVPLNSLQLYAQPLLEFEVLNLGRATLAVRTHLHATFAISAAVTIWHRSCISTWVVPVLVDLW